MTIVYKLSDIMYGVFDESMLTLLPSSADEQFDTLNGALAFIADELEEGGYEKKYSIYPCYYSDKKQAWFPIHDSKPIIIEAESFEPLEAFSEEGKDSLDIPQRNDRIRP